MAEESQTENSTETVDPVPQLREHQWKPGQSGNPGGRPKKRLIDEVLAELLENADSADAVEIGKALIAMAKKDHKAAQLVAERTQGKPTQKHEVTGGDGGPIQSRIIVEFVKPGEVS